MLHFPVAGMNAVVGMVGLVDLLTWSHCIVGTFSTEMSGVSAGKISAGKTKSWHMEGPGEGRKRRGLGE